MVQQEEAYSFTYSPDGTRNIVDTTPVPDGELWYVDTIAVSTDGGGSDLVDFAFGIYPDGIIPSVSTLASGKGGLTGSVNTGAVSSAAFAVGAYAYDLESILFGDDNATADGGTLTVIVGARRHL